MIFLILQEIKSYNHNYLVHKDHKLLISTVSQNVEKNNDSRLNNLYSLVLSEDNLNDDFYAKISVKYSYKQFMKWGVLKEKKYEELVLLIFLKMFNSNEKGLYGNDLENRLNSNIYLLLLAEHYYNISNEDPRKMLLLQDIVAWITRYYNYTENKHIYDEIKKLEIKHPETVYRLRRANILIPDSVRNCALQHTNE